MEENANEVAETLTKNEVEEAAIHLVTDRSEIERAVEAMIFASPRALSKLRLRNALAAFNYDISQLDAVLATLETQFATRGIQLVKVAGAFQFRSHPQCADFMERLLEEKAQRLSNSSLEVLAIVAYKQPVTRAEIDAVRGIDSGHLMRGLLEKDLIRTEGHAETPGRPLLYGTTQYFLEVFSLGSLDDLPKVEEFSRELVSGADEAILAADPGFESPLAANPDRGAFDENADEVVEVADFGLAEQGAEDDTSTEDS
jgi:segregation and condensation protein B